MQHLRCALYSCGAHSLQRKIAFCEGIRDLFFSQSCFCVLQHYGGRRGQGGKTHERLDCVHCGHHRRPQTWVFPRSLAQNAREMDYHVRYGFVVAMWRSMDAGSDEFRWRLRIMHEDRTFVCLAVAFKKVKVLQMADERRAQSVAPWGHCPQLRILGEPISG